MTFQGSVVTEQGQTFGIVIVAHHVLQNTDEADGMRAFGKRAFGLMPIVLMAQDSHGTPTYVGREDIVKFLASIDFRRIPWKEYTIN
jgi:hypothetical protein